jgi:hypothetical protein
MIHFSKEASFPALIYYFTSHIKLEERKVLNIC